MTKAIQEKSFMAIADSDDSWKFSLQMLAMAAFSIQMKQKSQKFSPL